MTAQDYPVTTPYGYVAGYPLHNGFHQGIDYGCPVGTPVVVNGVTIGLSGNTGYTTGPHLHLGKWLGGVVQNPLNGGFSFNSAVVSEIAEDADNGKFVRVQGNGASWVYCHLSVNNLVKVGQILKGGTMLTKEQIIVIYDLAFDVDDYQVNSDVIRAFTGKSLDELLTFIHSDPSWIAHKANISSAPGATELKPGIYQVK